MDKPKTTPRDFFLWAGAMIGLYGSVIAFIRLVFDYINYAMPNPLDYLPNNPYDSGIPYEMAVFIVLGPLCIILMRVIHGTIARDPSRADVWIRRWAVYLVLFVAGATLAGDLIALLYNFLAGNDITARFILKVLIVFLVAGAGFLHFLADLRGYWEHEPKKSLSVSIGVGVLGLVTIIAGFFIIGTPASARLYRYDDQKVTDLANIQNQIVSYWQYKQALPSTLTDLNDSLSSFTVPTDPQSSQAYEYHVTGKTSFTLCATFNKSENGTINYSVPEPMGLGGSGNNDNWDHASGHVCFSRTIDPQLYPPVPAATPIKAIQ